MDALKGAVALHAEIEIPHDEGVVVLQDAVRYQKSRFIHLPEHVLEDCNDRAVPVYFVEGVFEAGVSAVQLGKRAGIFLRYVLEKPDDAVQMDSVCHSPVPLWISQKYQR
jgi:hypothetical protein